MGKQEKPEKNKEKTNNKLDLIPKEVLKPQIVLYFEMCKTPESSKPFTLPGMALHLSVPIEDIIMYPKEGSLHSALISFAKAKCEDDLVNRMFNKSIDRSTGMLFLKNHFGYRDISNALTAEEKARQKKESQKSKLSISDILDNIERNNKK